MVFRDIGWSGIYCALLTQVDLWRVLVNTVMNLRFHETLGSFRVAAQLAAS
jgi:hypothetical protein